MSKEDFSSSESIDIKQYVNILLRFWYVPILAIGMCLGVAYYKLKYAIPQYKLYSTIQIKDKSTPSMGDQTLMASNLFSAVKNITNEVEVIKSYEVLETAVRELDQHFVYKYKGDIRDFEFYKDAPIQLQADSSFILVNVPIHILVLSNEAYALTLVSPSYKPYDATRNVFIDTLLPALNIIDQQYKFGQQVDFPLLHFSIDKRNPQDEYKVGAEYEITGLDLESQTYKVKEKVNVTVASKEGSIILINSTGPVKQREADLINKIVEVYTRKELEDKNQIAVNTVNFIDLQLSQIADSLNFAENRLQNFKSKNKVYNIDQAAEGAYTKMVELERMKSDLDLQNKYYTYLKEYVNNDRPFNDVVAPTTVNIADPLLNKLVGELVGLYQEKNTLQYTSNERSPAYQTLVLRIKSAKAALLENVDNIVHSSQIAVADINQRIRATELKLKDLPVQERNFINIQRVFTLNDNIYNYLLQKRAEASIARVSNASDAKIIEAAKIREALQVYPSPNNVYSIALFLALTCIIAFVLIYSFFFDHAVRSKEEVERKTDIPIIGGIGLVTKNATDPNAIYNIDRSILESFRSIRFNLQYFSGGKSPLVIGITSCISGDGKSFTSYNLAKVVALSEKKTLLICADLRKKMNSADYGVEVSDLGLSNYLIKGASFDQIVNHSNQPNLDIIFSGGIPPNASELLDSNQMLQLISEAKQNYEVIIIDSPPVGVVADYMALIKLMDINVFVVRFNHTPKQQLAALQLIKQKYPDKKHSLILNEIVIDNGYGYGYGYGYGEVKLKNKNYFHKLFKK